MLNRVGKRTDDVDVEQSITCPGNFIDYMVRQRKIDLPVIPDLCIISHSQGILEMASSAYPCQTIDLGARRPVEIHFFGNEETPFFAMVACPLGAPMAAVLLEELIALGFSKFIAVGIAGHPANINGPSLAPGDLVLVDRALICEGTSQHYKKSAEWAYSDPGLTRRLKDLLNQQKLQFVQGSAATTDAFYRETESFLEQIITQGVVAIDMELSALFTVSNFRQRTLASLVYISDIVQAGSECWEMAFTEERINHAEEQVFNVLLALLEEK